MAEQKSFVFSNLKLVIGGAVLFFGLSALLYWSTPTAGHYEVDSEAYQRVVTIFLQTGTMQDVGGTPPIHTQGYHFFLAVIYWLFGSSIGVLVCVQALLSFFAILLTAQTTFLLFGRICAQVVYALAVVDGAFLIYPQFVLAETALLFLLAFFFYKIACFYKTKKLSDIVQAGVILGVSLIVKPTALFLPIFLAVCFGFLSFFYTTTFTWSQLGIFTAATYVPVCLYIIRNGLTFGAYKFSFLTESALYLNFNAVVLSHVQDCCFEQALAVISAMVNRHYNVFCPEYWLGCKQFFFNLISTHPWIVCKLWMQNILKTFFGLYSVQLQLLFDPQIKGAVLPFFQTGGSMFAKVIAYFSWAFRSPAVGTCMLLEFFTNGLRWVLVLAGATQLFKEKQYNILLFFFTVISCFSLVTGFFGAGRYRITFEPLLLMLAAVGAVYLYKTYKRIKIGSFKK